MQGFTSPPKNRILLENYYLPGELEAKLVAPFIIGPTVELGLHLSDGTWHQNAF
jgi:hypothetical protein